MKQIFNMNHFHQFLPHQFQSIIIWKFSKYLHLTQKRVKFKKQNADIKFVKTSRIDYADANGYEIYNYFRQLDPCTNKIVHWTYKDLDNKYELNPR